jgi:hypothetical protein
MDSERLRVFISYSRRDSSALAEELVVGLELLGFEAILDRQDIAAAEDWEARLTRLIQTADTVIFLLSPEALKSERCAWEVRKAHDLSKRLIPIVSKAIRDDDVPVELRRLNYVFFSEGYSYSRSLGQVADALRADLDWIREHTRLAESALRWRERGGAEALLLRDDELEAAQKWLVARKDGAPEITDGQRAFIGASADGQAARASKDRQQLVEVANLQTARAEALAEKERTLHQLQRRTILGGIGAGALSIGIGGLSYRNIQAERRLARAEEASVEAAILREAARTDIEGQLVAYAASGGQLALDSTRGEQTSPYTKRLLERLSDPGTSLQAALFQAGRDVNDLTGREQRPFVSSDMMGDIYLHHRPATRQCKAIVVSAATVGSISYPNVPRDGNAWTTFLAARGFEVNRVSNPTYQQIVNAVDAVRFTRPEVPPQMPPSAPAAAPNAFLLFFFSGGGARAGRDLLLLAADSLTPRDNIDASKAITVEWLADQLRERAAASALILDTAFPDTGGSRSAGR